MVGTGSRHWIEEGPCGQALDTGHLGVATVGENGFKKKGKWMGGQWPGKQMPLHNFPMGWSWVN